MKLHDDPSIVELIASVIAILTILATIYAAVFNASEQAQVALVGLTGAVSSYFLTPKTYDNGKKDAKSGTSGPLPPIDSAPRP
ncbi:MAG: hypothetical protein EBR94_08760 [Bacteroidetes bacterium]|nr:hypothetical protein [Bacteroidota bacterium]